MIRRFAKWGLAMLVVLSTAGTVSAQGRGRGGFAGVPTRTAQGPAGVRGQVAPAARSSAFNLSITASTSPFVMRPQRHVIVAPNWGFYGGHYRGFYDPYRYVTAPPYYPVLPYVSSYVEAPYVAPSPSPSEVELSYQVEQLTREVERLRQDQAAAALQQSAPAPELPSLLPYLSRWCSAMVVDSAFGATRSFEIRFGLSMNECPRRSTSANWISPPLNRQISAGFYFSRYPQSSFSLGMSEI